MVSTLVKKLIRTALFILFIYLAHLVMDKERELPISTDDANQRPDVDTVLNTHVKGAAGQVWIYC